jgi:cyclic-di-GMP-binding protein
MASFSFDFISEIDIQEADNAVNQAIKDIEHRYDLRGSNCSVELKKTEQQIQIKADGEHFVSAAAEILRSKMIKRGISVQALDEQKPELMGGKSVRQIIGLKSGIDKEHAKKITALVKENKLKVTAQIVDEKVRITGKSKDDLQQCIALVRATDLGFPVQVDNFR